MHVLAAQPGQDFTWDRPRPSPARGSGDRTPPRCTRPLPGAATTPAATCRDLPAATPLAAPTRGPPPRRSWARAAQVGAELRARPASCMTQAGRRRAAGSARSLHHPARGRRLTGHVTRGSRARRAPGRSVAGATWRAGKAGPRGAARGGREELWATGRPR